MIRSIIKRVIYFFLKPSATWFFKKPRIYRYKDLKVTVLPDVFFPHFTLSTRIMLNYLEETVVASKSVLELGAGCGAISFRCAQRGAIVTASDINPAAIENLRLNENDLKLGVTVVHSDLFSSLPSSFDLILINPPYYQKEPKNDAEKAWFCGAEMEYFQKLFGQLPDHLNADSNVLMILSEDCDIDRIKEIAEQHDQQLTTVFETKKMGELNFIFSVEPRIA